MPVTDTHILEENNAMDSAENIGRVLQSRNTQEHRNGTIMHLQGLSLAHASLVCGQTKQSTTYHIVLHIIVIPDWS